MIHSQTKIYAHILKHTDQGEVQFGPIEVHCSLSSSVRCSCRSETAPLVMAGLVTDAANAGPPVVFIICERERRHSQRERKRNY